MSQQDADRWDARYAAGEYAGRTHATALLEHWISCVPRGPAIDIACGVGRNAIFMAQSGLETEGLDVSAKALERAQTRAASLGVDVKWRCEDLDSVELANDHYQLIMVARFLDRRLFPQLLTALRPGGYLIYETHLATNQVDVGGPGNQRFRLQPQELLHLVHPLRVVHYFEGVTRDPDGAAMCLAQVVACRGDGGF